MRSTIDIFNEIPALQRQGLNFEQIAAQLERLSCEGEDTRIVQVIPGSAGGKPTIELRFILERETIRFNGTDWEPPHRVGAVG